MNFQLACMEDTQCEWIDKVIYKDYMIKVAELLIIMQTTFFYKQ